MRLALAQGRSLQEVMRANTSTEFTDWKWYFDQEANAFNPTFQYLARIAMEVAKLRLGKHGKQLKLKDFILNFVKQKAPASAPVDIETRTTRSKNFWMALCGYGIKKKVENPAATQRQPNGKPNA